MGTFLWEILYHFQRPAIITLGSQFVLFGIFVSTRRVMTTRPGYRLWSCWRVSDRLYAQCVWLPVISCPTRGVRSFRSGAETLLWTITRSTTLPYALLDRWPEWPERSRWSLTTTDGLTSSCYRTTKPRTSVGTERSLSMRFSATKKTTHSRGSDLTRCHRTQTWTIYYSKYEHSREVCELWPCGIASLILYIWCGTADCAARLNTIYRLISHSGNIAMPHSQSWGTPKSCLVSR